MRRWSPDLASAHQPKRKVNAESGVSSGYVGSRSVAHSTSTDSTDDAELAAWSERSAAAAAYRRMIAAMSGLCWAAQRRPDYAPMPSAIGRSDHEKVATLRSMIEAPGPLSAYRLTLLPVLCTLADALDELRTLALTEPQVSNARSGDVQLLFLDHRYQPQWQLSFEELRWSCAQVRTVCDWATEVFNQVGCALEA